MTSGRLIALFALAALVLGVTAQSPELLVRLAQVTHRHGARNPLTTANVPFICGDTYQCGWLNDVGQQMLLAVGDFVRQRYNDAAIVGEPFFPATHYNASLIRSRSTSMERTLQSSTSFLHSIFTNETEFFPVVYTIDLSSDYLVNTDTFPAAFIQYEANPMPTTLKMNAYVDLHFTYEELVAMSEEVHLPDACDDYDTRGGSCAYDLYDIATSFNASGRITDFPLLMAAQPGLNDVERQWFRLMYSYNSSDSEDRIHGSSAAQLGKEMIQNMLAYMKEPTFKVYEYSGHDTTIAPLGAVLGDQGNITMLPDYAASIIVELVENTTSGEYLVRIVRGQPMRQPDGSYAFQQLPFKLQCAKTSPFTPYDAEGSMCPLEDFSNFVLSHLPDVVNGECMLNDEDYATLQCPTRTNMPVPPNCLTYRKRCPAVACPENQVLSAADWQCYTLPTNTSNEFDVVSVAVVHNAGATTPQYVANYTSTDMCGNLGCGELTPVGIDMMLSLGEYLQTRYNDLNVVQSPVFSSNIFDIAVTNSRARRADNNIQSTSALLAGLYPSESSFPISYNRRKLNRDLVLNAAAVPPAFLRSTMTTPDELGDLLNNLVDASFTLAELVELGNSLGIGSFYCGPEEQRSACALHIYDILNSYNANGQLADSPQLQTVLANLKPVRATYVDYVVGYNTSDPLAAQQGYVGGVLASYIAGKFSNNVPFSNNANFLWELSTDELTLSALGVALSANAADALLPQYGEAYFIELLQQRGGSVMKFRVLRGTPSIVGNNDYYTYSTTPVTIRCMTNLNNTVYEAQECNYADFMLYMNSIQAPVPQGYCNVSTTLYDRLMCPTTVAEAGNTGLFPPCKQYRSVCSEYACPANYVLSAANSQCYPIAASNAPAAARQEEEIALALREEQMGERALSRAATTKTAQLRDVVERRRERKARQVVPKKKSSAVHRRFE